MKKLFVSQIKFVMLLSLMFLANITPVLAASESEVVYDGDAKMVITPLGEDLFLNFKSMMPGAQAEQIIKISNTLDQTVFITLRAENANSSKFKNKAAEEISKEILDLLELELVVTDSYGTEKTIYSGAASGPEGSGTGTGVKLGTFAKGYEGELVAKVTLPETLGNKYAGKEAKVKWIFSVNETVESHVEKDDSNDSGDLGITEDENHTDDKTPSDKTPKVLSYIENKIKTGDTAKIGGWISALIVSGIISCIVLKKRKKRV